MSEVKTRVAVVFGGRSGEHGISCATAAGVLGAIDRERFDVVPVGITREGKWALVEDNPQALELHDNQEAEITLGGLGVQEVSLEYGGELVARNAEGTSSSLGKINVVFPLLHGPYGEDGTIQGMLEMLNVRYVGCGVTASAAGMDKHVTKVLLADAGIEVAPYELVTPLRWRHEREQLVAACHQLSLPLFVKPARAGSSLGISKVDDFNQLEQAIEAAAKVDPKVLVESGIKAREVECAVLGGRYGEAPRVAPPGEVVMDANQGAGEFYDFETKYLAHDAVQMVCPAQIPDAARDLIRATAAKAFTALDCEGLTRVDFFLTEDGRAIVNEVNTMPGFTPFSMYPYMWQVAGVDYTSLVSELIDLALARPLNVNR